MSTPEQLAETVRVALDALAEAAIIVPSFGRTEKPARLALDSLLAAHEEMRRERDEALSVLAGEGWRYAGGYWQKISTTGKALDDWKVRAEAAERERDALQHIIDCAKTPLMRDVLAERDALKEALQHVEFCLDGSSKTETLAYVRAALAALGSESE